MREYYEDEDFIRRAPKPDGRTVAAKFRDCLSHEELGKLLARASAPPNAVATPFTKWNAACRDEGGMVGPALGWVVVLAGLTGEGKSLLALNLTAQAVRDGHKVCYFTGEMSYWQCQTRVAAIITKRPVRHLETGRFSAEEAVATVAQAEQVAQLAKANLYVNQPSVGDVSEIQSAVEWFVHEHGIRVFVFDYLQRFGDERHASRAREIASVSREIQFLARDLNILVYTAVQFSRQQSAAEPPSIFNLKDSSEIEQDADQVLLIDHTTRMVNAPTHEAWQWIVMGKNRHGPKEAWPVLWNYENLVCRELYEAEGEPAPSWVPEKYRATPKRG